MLHSFLLGILITLFYDLLRILRRVIPHGAILISLEDLSFWVLAAAGIFYLLYYENNGIFRWFSVIGALAGMLLYKETLSGPFVRLASAMANLLVRQLLQLMAFLFTPFRFLGCFCVRLLRRGKRRLGRDVRMRCRRLKSRLSGIRHNSMLTAHCKAFTMKLPHEK